MTLPVHRSRVALVTIARAVVACCVLSGGCGPIEYVSQVTRRASNEVDAAREVANEKDPEFVYWYTLAVEYLRKAREEASFADYAAAHRFGRRAEYAAKQARRVAIGTGDKAPATGADVEPSGTDAAP
jgi:hypothetical protein